MYKLSTAQKEEYTMNHLQQNQKRISTKPQREFLSIIMVSLVFAAVMLISSSLFADIEHSQSFIIPLIAMLFVPFFLVH